jgi:hypothetical protein
MSRSEKLNNKAKTKVQQTRKDINALLAGILTSRASGWSQSHGTVLIQSWISLGYFTFSNKKYTPV